MRGSKLIRKQLDRRINGIRPLLSEMVTPPSGWIRAIRNALGMSSEQLAKRMGVTQSGVARLESSERRGVASLTTLHKAAEALDCTLVYAFIPNRTLEDTLVARARGVAAEQLGRVDHTMRLEAQDVDAGTLREELASLTTEILNGNLTRLWD